MGRNPSKLNIGLKIYYPAGQWCVISIFVSRRLSAQPWLWADNDAGSLILKSSTVFMYSVQVVLSVPRIDTITKCAVSHGPQTFNWTCVADESLLGPRSHSPSTWASHGNVICSLIGWVAERAGQDTGQGGSELGRQDYSSRAHASWQWWLDQRLDVRTAASCGGLSWRRHCSSATHVSPGKHRLHNVTACSDDYWWCVIFAETALHSTSWRCSSHPCPPCRLAGNVLLSGPEVSGEHCFLLIAAMTS